MDSPHSLLKFPIARNGPLDSHLSSRNWDPR